MCGGKLLLAWSCKKLLSTPISHWYLRELRKPSTSQEMLSLFYDQTFFEQKTWEICLKYMWGLFHRYNNMLHKPLDIILFDLRSKTTGLNQDLSIHVIYKKTKQNKKINKKNIAFHSSLIWLYRQCAHIVKVIRKDVFALYTTNNRYYGPDSPVHCASWNHLYLGKISVNCPQVLLASCPHCFFQHFPS